MVRTTSPLEQLEESIGDPALDPLDLVSSSCHEQG